MQLFVSVEPMTNIYVPIENISNLIAAMCSRHYACLSDLARLLCVLPALVEDARLNNNSCKDNATRLARSKSV